ncbi:MAG TPA: metalloprotease TldD [Kofleriaceae bacterium]|nr:metalloprotease TldD [Kofleriaceae bacterium]
MSTSPRAARAPFLPGGDTEIDAQIAQRLLSIALDSGGDYADLFFEYNIGADYVLEEEKIKTVGRGITMGLGVRVTKGDATGYAYAEDLTQASMEHAARTAGQIASGGGAPAPVAVNPVVVQDLYPVGTPTIDLPPAEKLALLRAADRAARAHDPRIVKVEASFTEQLREILVVTSDGKIATDRLPLIRFGVRAVAEDGPKRQSGSSGGGGRLGMEYFQSRQRDAEWHGREAARIALAMLEAREAPAGQLPVVLAAGDSGILLHEAVGHGLEADFNRKKTSNYSDQIGQQVASELCTVIDSGVLEGSRGSINVDDEGNVSRENVLIENGILVGYMHDQLSAKHFGVTPSGNGRRQSFRCMPMPRMTNTSMRPGEHGPEEIIQSVERGIYAKRFSGGQVNISNGDFVFSLTESYLIENGKLTAPLKGVNLIGNGPEALRKVTMVGSDYELSDGIWTCGKDGQSVPVGVGTPTVKVSSITVGGTQTS